MVLAWLLCGAAAVSVGIGVGNILLAVLGSAFLFGSLGGYVAYEILTRITALALRQDARKIAERKIARAKAAQQSVN